ncbi:hypothetical protein BCR43DRAFT_482574 [Syncephalastrum racemosum]|uniref:Arrestin C-terminal-like domain-containing protein n=1 Tax=Syncephalastrum racemosum TaxID=13706 RepID=A0A1X2HTX2_SYNRA|nr:hypothetical protein BCR43DRAFT_482574 [Syncephalastrum racemosum]
MGNKSTKTIFSVQEVIWGRAQPGSVQELKSGSHMYLFAIKLPNVNYPPSTQGSNLGHRIEYQLQGFLALQQDGRTMETNIAPVMYLPFVPCTPEGSHLEVQRQAIIQRGDGIVELKAQLLKSAYCPGDVCTIKFALENKSDHRISTVQISLVVCTSKKRQTMYSETVYLSAPKQSNMRSVCRFTIPSACPPTTFCQDCHISYHILITVPNHHSSAWPFYNFTSNSSSYASSTSSSTYSTSSSEAKCNALTIPLTIATVPNTYPVPPHMQLPLPNFRQGSHELPSFIPSIESPLASPRSPSVESPLATSPERRSLLSTQSTLFDGRITHQDVTGHLMVPMRTRRPSTSSSLSSFRTDCSADVSTLVSDSSFPTRLASA